MSPYHSAADSPPSRPQTSTQACLLESEHGYQEPAQETYRAIWPTAPLLYARETIFTLYIAPLHATCDINDAWQQAFIRIPQVVIKGYSSCTPTCQGGPTGRPPGLLWTEALPCGPVPLSDLQRTTSLCIVVCSTQQQHYKSEKKAQLFQMFWTMPHYLFCVYVLFSTFIFLSRWPSCGTSGLADCCTSKSVRLHYRTH